jgi:hypothetical protein
MSLLQRLEQHLIESGAANDPQSTYSDYLRRARQLNEKHELPVRLELVALLADAFDGNVAELVNVREGNYLTDRADFVMDNARPITDGEIEALLFAVYFMTAA